jgi:hypothetical protein
MEEGKYLFVPRGIIPAGALVWQTTKAFVLSE